jgi:hypothetical protein
VIHAKGDFGGARVLRFLGENQLDRSWIQLRIDIVRRFNREGEVAVLNRSKPVRGERFRGWGRDFRGILGRDQCGRLRVWRVTATTSARGARTATATAKVATERSSKQPGAREGEPAMSRTSARPGVKADSRADLLEVPLRADAEVKTTLQLSPRRATSQGEPASVIVSLRRKG